MSEEEKRKLFDKAILNAIKELAENPEEAFDNLKLQKKYNNVMKEKIKWQQTKKKLKEYIEKNKKFNYDENSFECKVLFREMLEIIGDE